MLLNVSLIKSLASWHLLQVLCFFILIFNCKRFLIFIIQVKLVLRSALKIILKVNLLINIDFLGRCKFQRLYVICNIALILNLMNRLIWLIHWIQIDLANIFLFLWSIIISQIYFRDLLYEMILIDIIFFNRYFWI